MKRYKLLIFFTIFVDLLGFGIVIPILGPTGAEFVNERTIHGVLDATRTDLNLTPDDISYDNKTKLFTLHAPEAAKLASLHGELERRLIANGIAKDQIDGTTATQPAAGVGEVMHIASKSMAGHTGGAAALLMCVFSLMQFLFSPLWGRLSDKHGRRPILLMSLCGSTLSYILFAVSRSFTLLFVSRLLAGLFAANVTAALAYIADITEDHDRTAGIGIVGAAFGMGIAFGPVFGGVATDVYHHFVAVTPATAHVGAGIAASIICGINLIWAWFGLPESLPVEMRGKLHYDRFAGFHDAVRTLRNPIVGPLILMLFLVTFAFSNLEVSFSLYAQEVLGMNLTHIYRLFIFIGLVIGITQGVFVRRIVKKVPESTLMVWGALILVIGLALLPIWTDMAMMLTALGILAVGQGVCQPSVLSLISRRTKATHQGNVFGTSQSASSMARIVGPAFGGILYDFGHRLPFWIAAVIMLGAVFWGIEVRGRLSRSEPGAEGGGGGTDAEQAPAG